MVAVPVRALLRLDTGRIGHLFEAFVFAALKVAKLFGVHAHRLTGISGLIGLALG